MSSSINTSLATQNPPPATCFSRVQKKAREWGSFFADVNERDPLGFFADIKNCIYSKIIGKKEIEGSNCYSLIQAGDYVYGKLSCQESGVRRKLDCAKGHFDQFSGVAYKEAGKWGESCIHRAFENYRDLYPKLQFPPSCSEEDAPRNPLVGENRLNDWKNVSPLDAEKGDHIFYFKSNENFPSIFTEHFGVVEKVTRVAKENPKISIVSKWGKYPIYESDIDRIPLSYGMNFLLMRHSLKSQLATESSAAKIQKKYDPFLVAVSAVFCAGLYLAFCKLRQIYLPQGSFYEYYEE